ncbi:Flagellar biosynthesis protein FlhF [Dissulfuribacter thermophilus]|uniref:Flagellar biosynthesis protein FlhF n=1 Tax=Dissulfuribacter thermophilus TaxID=1156395 RepID=A0A1B9F826_9BACT|nr:ATP/GTP-binding protein [Dissulfuribacter thermophilus]OCC16089.1 Flagellar biosynthesis protein FlhF [Dissulfuribacter thermophilus]
MKIQRFRARDMASAFELVKKNMGDDAVIIETGSVEGENGARLFEVVAAVDLDEVQHDEFDARSISRRKLYCTENELLSASPKFFGIIGPSGSGKTTVLLKLAFRFKQKGYRVKIVNVDNIRLGAHEALKKVSHILEIPYYNAKTPLELLRIVSASAEDEILLADFPGVNLFDEEKRDRLKRFFVATPGLKALAVMPSNMNPVDLKALVREIYEFPLCAFVLTKVDELKDRGRVREIVADLSVDVVYVSSGQRVTADFEEFKFSTLGHSSCKKRQFFLKALAKKSLRTQAKEIISGIHP